METKKYCAYNLSRESSLSSKLTVADSAHQPLKVLKVMIGGLALDAESGLWLKPVLGVPDVPRLFPFDLVYLDGENRVIQGVEVLPGVEFPPVSKQVVSALVLPQQTLASTRTRPGDHLVICFEEEMTRLLQRISDPAVSAPIAENDATPATQNMAQPDMAHSALNSLTSTPITQSTHVERSRSHDISDLFPAASIAQGVGRMVKDFHDEPRSSATAPDPTPAAVPVVQSLGSSAPGHGTLPELKPAVALSEHLHESPQITAQQSLNANSSSSHPPSPVVQRVDSLVAETLNSHPTPASPVPFTESRRPSIEPLQSSPAPVSAANAAVKESAKPPAAEVQKPSAPVTAATAATPQSTKASPTKSASLRVSAPSAPSVGMKGMGSTVSNYPSWHVSTSTARVPIVPGAKSAAEDVKSSNASGLEIASPQTTGVAPQVKGSSEPKPRRSDTAAPINPIPKVAAPVKKDGRVPKGQLDEPPRGRISASAKSARIAQTPIEQSVEEATLRSAVQTPVVQREEAPAVGRSMDAPLSLRPSAQANPPQAEQRPAEKSKEELAADARAAAIAEAKLKKELAVERLIHSQNSSGYSPAPVAKMREDGGDSTRREEIPAPSAIPKRSVEPQLTAQEPAQMQKAELHAKAEAHAKAKESLTTRFMRWLEPDAVSHDRRKVERRNLPGLVAYYFSGGAPKGHEIADISPAGFYMITKDRWMPETMIQMTLQKPGGNGKQRRESLTVLTKVVRLGADGVGAKFVLAEDLDPYSREILPTQATDKKALARFL
jgi:hypothetical protein